MQALADIAPDLGRYIIGFGFGEIYNRPHLDNQRRELVTLAALAAQGGCEKQLAVHIHAALNVGLSREEIVETLYPLRAVSGFPESAERGVYRQRSVCGRLTARGVKAGRLKAIRPFRRPQTLL